MTLKKIKAGMYETVDGKITIYKDSETGKWYADDTKTGDSVVDCEDTLREIKWSLRFLHLTYITPFLFRFFLYQLYCCFHQQQHHIRNIITFDNMRYIYLMSLNMHFDIFVYRPHWYNVHTVPYTVVSVCMIHLKF